MFVTTGLAAGFSGAAVVATIVTGVALWLVYDATRTWLSVLDPGFAVHLVNGSSFGVICASQTLRRMRTRMRPVSLPVPRSAHLTGRDG